MKTSYNDEVVPQLEIVKIESLKEKNERRLLELEKNLFQNYSQSSKKDERKN